MSSPSGLLPLGRHISHRALRMRRVRMPVHRLRPLPPEPELLGLPDPLVPAHRHRAVTCTGSGCHSATCSRCWLSCWDCCCWSLWRRWLHMQPCQTPLHWARLHPDARLMATHLPTRIKKEKCVLCTAGALLQDGSLPTDMPHHVDGTSRACLTGQILLHAPSAGGAMLCHPGPLTTTA